MGSVEAGRRLREWVPRWWRGETGVAGSALRAALWPAEMLFRGGVAVRNGAYDAGVLRVEAAPIPVISVGNLGVGGAGKTPVAAWIVGRLLKWGRRPAVVLRGYGADEIAVHEELNPGVPVVAAGRRVEAAREAAAKGCDVAVVDDGFQHRALRRDLDLVLVSADGWGANLHLLPRGPWREGLGALRRADFALVTRKSVDVAAAGLVERALGPYIDPQRIVRCRIAATRLVRVGPAGEAAATAELTSLRGRPVLAVTSLADPRPFVENLRAEGASVQLAAYPDHHAFSGAEAAELAARAGDVPVVMTRKEAVKLRELLPENVEAWMVDQQVEIESGAEVLAAALRQAVGA